MARQRNPHKSKFRIFNDPKTGLTNSKELIIDEDDILSQLLPAAKDNKFLGLFTEKQLAEIFAQFEIITDLKTSGFSNIKFQLNTDDPYQHSWSLYDEEIKKEKLLVEMVLRKTCLPQDKIPDNFHASKVELLFVEWLQAQNPRKRFSADKPRLPGQKFPGLRLAVKLLDILIFFAKQMQVQAVAAVPGHYHNAVIFSQFFKYINPESEGKLRALKRDVGRRELSQLSWAVEFNCIKSKSDDTEFKWFLDWQVYPIQPEFADYFNSVFYKSNVTASWSRHHYIFDEELYQSKKDKIHKIADAII